MRQAHGRRSETYAASARTDAHELVSWVNRILRLARTAERETQDAHELVSWVNGMYAEHV
jgi:hypothetical protein